MRELPLSVLLFPTIESIGASHESMSDQGRAANKVLESASSKSTLVPPSPDCTFKSELGKKQTGYLPREKLMAFLKATFGQDKEFAAQVGLV